MFFIDPPVHVGGSDVVHRPVPIGRNFHVSPFKTRGGIDPQKPLCSVTPERWTVGPPVLLMPTPVHVIRGMPTQLVARIEGSIVQASCGHPLLRKIQRPFHIVVEGQRPAAPTKQSESRRIDIRGRQP